MTPPSWTTSSRMLGGRAQLVAWLTAASALAACATDASSTSLGLSPTEITVRPADFMVGASCSPSPGGMRSYVVSLYAFDDASDTTAFPLPSSRPTPCSMTFGMREFVVAGKRYVAEIDGYEEDASSLTPVGGASGGNRAMVDAEGNVVSPRWSSRCGEAAASATVALENASTPVENCTPLVDSRASETRVRLAAADIAGAEACTEGALLDLRMLSGMLELPSQLACDAEPLDLLATPGSLARFYARLALPDDSIAGTECEVLSVNGQTVSPVCGTLSTTGSVTLDPTTGAGSSESSACPLGEFFEVRSGGDLVSAMRLACGTRVFIGPLEPGLIQLKVSTFAPDGTATAGGATCMAEVEPGRTVDAACL